MNLHHKRQNKANYYTDQTWIYSIPWEHVTGGKILTENTLHLQLSLYFQEITFLSASHHWFMCICKELFQYISCTESIQDTAGKQSKVILVLIFFILFLRQE